MKPGPPPKPTRYRVLLSNPSGKPLNQREPKPEIGVPEAPPWLSQYGREAWDYYMPKLAKYRVISDLDQAVLAIFVEAYADFRMAREKLNERAEVVATVNTKTGPYEIVSPYLCAANKAAALLHRSLGELGLTPSARSALIARKDDGVDPDDPFGLFS